MKETTIKIHIERDYSFVEFDSVIDLDTGDGMPDPEIISGIWAALPAKDNSGAPSAKSSAPRPRREPPATPAQRRLLEKEGEWKDGITKAEASKILSGLGY